MKKVCGNLAYEKEIATIKKITKTTKKYTELENAGLIKFNKLFVR